MNYKNKILIAKPLVKDPIFGGSVVLITKHTEEGAVGFILNGPNIGKVAFGAIPTPEETPQDVQDVVDAVESGEIKAVEMQYGGPIGGPQSLFMIHGYSQFDGAEEELPFDIIEEEEEDAYEIGGIDEPEGKKRNAFGQDEDDDSEIMPGVYFGSPNTLVRIFSAKLGDNKFRFLTGQSAWAPGQLESEISAGAWEIVDATPEMVFDPDELAKLAPQQKKKQKSDWFDILSN